MSRLTKRFSALQRAEIAEIQLPPRRAAFPQCFSALQRAEIAEICVSTSQPAARPSRFSALQRAEIAEIEHVSRHAAAALMFQCSSTSRNC